MASGWSFRPDQRWIALSMARRWLRRGGLEAFVTKKRDRRAELKFLKKIMKQYSNPKVIVTDKLRSYKAAMKVIGNESRQETVRWLNNRAKNSHQPFRRRERAMIKFRNAKSLQKFVSIHASVHNHFNLERHLIARQQFKINRATALAEWRQLVAWKTSANHFSALSHFTLTMPTSSLSTEWSPAMFWNSGMDSSFCDAKGIALQPQAIFLWQCPANSWSSTHN